MKILLFALVLLIVSPSFAQHAEHADAQRQANVAKRGADVMPFDLAATTHIFTKSEDGGTQRVVVKDSADLTQIRLVRQHLKDIRTQFKAGDFSGPSHIHGEEMPGLAELRKAKPGQLSIDYREVQGGAELTHRTRNPQLVKAIHDWFDAQLADHGHDAMEGHQHQHPHP